MKEKNSKKRKVLLIATSVVLVALISIGTTLAYLSAKTIEKDNIFKAGGGITLELLEPKFDAITQPINTEPGKTTDKDPMVQNLTDDEPIIVGTRVSFFINTTPATYKADGTVNDANEDDDDYVQVPYNIFKEYVTLNGLTTKTSSDEYTGSSGNWYNVTSEVPGANNVNGDLFFIYDKILQPYNGEISLNTTTNAYKFDNTVTDKTNDNTDNTAPIFTSVTPNSTITIMNGGTCTDKTGAYDEDDNPTGNVKNGVVKGTYGKFNYRIVINAWGVKASDPTLTAGINNPTDKNRVEQAETELLDKLKVTA